MTTQPKFRKPSSLLWEVERVMHESRKKHRNMEVVDMLGLKRTTTNRRKVNAAFCILCAQGSLSAVRRGVYVAVPTHRIVKSGVAVPPPEPQLLLDVDDQKELKFRKRKFARVAITKKIEEELSQCRTEQKLYTVEVLNAPKFVSANTRYSEDGKTVTYSAVDGRGKVFHRTAAIPKGKSIKDLPEWEHPDLVRASRKLWDCEYRMKRLREERTLINHGIASKVRKDFARAAWAAQEFKCKEEGGQDLETIF